MKEALVKAQILLVDEVGDRLDRCQDIYVKAGCVHVTALTNPLMMGSRKADLTVLGWGFQNLSGELALKRLLQGRRTQFHPVIAAIAVGEGRDHIDALQNGAMDFIRNPIHPWELLFRTRKLLKMLEQVEAVGTISWPIDEGEGGAFANYLAASKILVLDDQAIQLMVMSRFLSAAGFANVVAMSNPGKLAEQLADAEADYDIVVLDYHLPDWDGLELVRRLKEERFGEVPPQVLMITADHERELPQRAMEAGADDFLFKPLDREELVLRVRNLLKVRFVMREASAAESNL